MSKLKEHADTLTVISVLIGAAIWMTTQLHNLENRLNDKMTSLDKRLIVIETVMTHQGYNVKGIAANIIDKEEKEK